MASQRPAATSDVGATQAPPTLQGERRLIEVLREEFRVLAALAHPRLARVYDFGQLPPSSPLPGSEGRGGYFPTREFIDGSDLRTASTGAPLGEKACAGASSTDAWKTLPPLSEMIPPTIAPATRPAGKIHQRATGAGGHRERSISRSASRSTGAVRTLVIRPRL